ncbi:MAG TPA: hypothetical protein VFE62_12090 [Gemmataceae bacterium]|nr:hypothetical protein [Gemmataceae bacterium]
MLRFSTFTAVILTGAFGTFLWSLQSADSCPDPLIRPAPSGEKVHELLTSYGCFKQTLTATLYLLENGDIKLEEARTRIYDSSLRYYPDYLEHIKLSEHATTDLDRIARNLIGHLKNGGLMADLRVLALEVEYAELQRHASVPSGPRVWQ